MASIWDKIDMGLPTIYVNFLRVRDEGADSVACVEPVVAEGGPLHVSRALVGHSAGGARRVSRPPELTARLGFGIATACSGTTIPEVSNLDPLRAFRSPIRNGSVCR
jgi:hypothetical protein